MTRFWWIGAFVALSIAGCFEPNFEDRHIKCGPGGTCPPGLTCGADNLCSLQGGTHDGGDTTKPAAPTLSAVSPVSPANNNNPMLTGNAEAGSTVDIYGDAACTMHLASGTSAELSSPGIRVAITDDTTYAFAATATDAANNVSPCSTSLPFVEDSTPPAVPTLTNTIPASPSRSVVPTVHGTSGPGETIQLYNNDTCAGTPIGMGAADSTGAFAIVATVSPAVVTTIYANAKDVAGNVSACSTILSYEQNASAVGIPTLDTTVPASPSGTVTNPMITGTAEAGVTVKLFTNPACTGTPVATGPAIANNTYSITVNVSPNSTTIYYAQATDTAVNQSSQCSSASITYTEDATAPQPPTLISSNPVSPSNSQTPTISGSAEAGSKVQLYSDNTCSTTVGTPGTTTAGGTFAIATTGITAPTTFYATAKDPAGNTSACSGTSVNYNYDATAPAAPAINPVTNPASPSRTDNAPFVTVTAENGSTIHVYLTMNCSGSQTASGVSTGSPLGISVTVPSNSTTNISANATDVAGNTSMCSNYITYTHDSIAPSPPVITSTSPMTPANGNNPTISGTAEMGSTVRLYTDSNCSTQTGSSQVASAGTFAIAINVGDNSVTSLYTTATDVAGNPSSCASSAFDYTEDSTPPGTPTLNTLPPSSTVTTPTLTGTAETGAKVYIYASTNCTGTPAAMTTATNGTYSAMVTVSPNTSTPFSAKATDPAGNPSAGCSNTFNYVHDNMAPPLPTNLASSLPSPNSSNTPSITGMAEAGSTVRLYTNINCSSTIVGTGTALGNGTFSIPVSVASDSVTTFYATSQDPAGNISTMTTNGCSTSAVTYTEDSTAPNPPGSFTSNPMSPSFNASPSISGTSEANAAIGLFTNSNCTGTAAFTGTANGAGAWMINNVTVNLNATTTFWGQATDTAGNPSACSPTSFSYLHDNVKPGNVTITGSTPGSPASSTNPQINGTGDTNVTVRIFTTSDCSGTPLNTGATNGTSFAINVTVNPNVTTNLYANAIDAAGNTSAACSTVYAYTEDQSNPAIPSNLATSPPSPVNNNNPSITGTSEQGATVNVYTDSQCLGAVAGTIVAGVGGGFAIPVTAVSNTTTTFYVEAFDAAHNPSGCSGGVPYTEDSIPPSIPQLTGTTPSSPYNSTKPTVNGTGDVGSTVTIYTTSNCAMASAVGTGTVPVTGSFAITLTTDLPLNTQSTLYADSNDTAQNHSTCSAGIVYVEDSIAPDITGGTLATNPVTNSNQNSPAITGTTEANATVRLYSDSSCSTAAGQGTASGTGLFSVTVSPPVVDNTTTTFYVRVSDAATNTSACGATNSIVYHENSNVLETPVLTGTNPASPQKSNLAPSVTGTTQATYNIEIFKNDSTCSGTAVATLSNSGASFSIPVSVTANSTNTFYAKANQGGNYSGCSNGITYVTDSNPPVLVTNIAVSPIGPANNNNPTVSGTAEANSIVKLYPSGSCTVGQEIGQGTATPGGTFSFTTANLADNSNNTIFATATDAAGNTSTCSTSTVTYVEDSQAPIAPTVSSTTPVSPSRTNTSPTVNGTCESNATVKIYKDSACTGTIVASGPATGTAFSIQVSVSQNTTTTFYARAMDGAGNTGPCSSTSVTYTHDNQGPLAPTNLAMSPASPNFNLTPSVTGNAEAGSNVQIFTTSNCSGTVAGSGPATTGTFSAQVTITANTTATYYAMATDQAGNPGACSTGITYVNDSTNPNPPVFTGSTPTSPSNMSTTPTINGTAEAGSTVSLYSTTNCGTAIAGATATISSTAPFTFAIPVTVPPNQTTNFWAKTKDIAGNFSACTSTPFAYTHDNVAPGAPTGVATSPSTTITTPKNFNTPNLTGTTEANATVQVYLSTTGCTGSPILTQTTATAAFSIPLTVTDNSTNTYFVNAKDPAGTTGPCTSTGVTYYEDSTPPGVPSLTSLSPTSPHNTTTTNVIGSTTLGANEPNATIKLYSDNQCTSALLGSGTTTGAGGFTVQATVPSGATTTIFATATDFAGNASACSTTSLTYVEDETAPNAPTNLATSPVSPSFNVKPTVTGGAEAGSTVTVFTGAGCGSTVYGSTTAAADGTFSVTPNVGVQVASNTTTNFYAQAVDPASNPSPCSAALAYTHDNIANPPHLTSTSPTSPSASSTTPSIIGTGEANSNLSLYKSNNCTGTAIPGSIDASGNFTVTTSVTANTSTTFSATLIDQAGNPSACSNTLGLNGTITFVSDQTAPTAPSISSAVANEHDSIHVTWSAGSDPPNAAANLRYDVCATTSATPNPPTSCTVQGTTNPGVTAYDLTGLTAGTRYWLWVRTLDQVNYVSAWSGPLTDRTWVSGTITQIAAGSDFTCALIADGTVRCWGNNNTGELGDGSYNPHATTMTPVTGLTDIVQIAAGGYNSNGIVCARQASGNVYCWGSNGNGELGDGSTTTRPTPVAVSGISNAEYISVGQIHACAVLKDGTAKCWGYNGYGELGDGTATTPANHLPVVVSGLTNAVTIDVGLYFSCALIGNGDVKCWGKNDGVLGTGSTGANALTPVTVALANNEYAKQLEVGDYHACVVLTTGQVRCWGLNATGQIGNGTTTDAPAPVTVVNSSNAAITGVFAISAGGSFESSNLNHYGETCALYSFGNVYCWGYNAFGEVGNGTQTTPVSNPVALTSVSSVVSINVGQEHMCYVSVDGTAKCVGNGASGRLGNQNTGVQTTVVAVTGLYGPLRGISIKSSNSGFNANGNTTCALLSNGTIECWGLGTSGQRGDNNQNANSAIPATPVVDSGNFPLLAKQITVGEAHACALTGNNYVYCWGSDANGQLGDNDSANKAAKGHAVYANIGVATAVSAGNLHTCAVQQSGNVYCWGYDYYSNLGNGVANDADHFTPVYIGAASPAKTIGMNGLGGCSIFGDGTSKCWGYNYYGNQGTGTATTTSPYSLLSPTAVTGVANAVSVSGNYEGACWVSAGGYVHCAGRGSEGEMENGMTIATNATPIQLGANNWSMTTGGAYSSCGTWYGQLWCWGKNNVYQLGINNVTNQVYDVQLNVPSTKDVGLGMTHGCSLDTDGLAWCWGQSVSGSCGDNNLNTHNVTTPQAVIYFP